MAVEPGRLRAGTLTGAAAAALLLAAAPAGATGFYLQDQSVKGSGRANSGEAADRDSASLWWNPAAIGGTARTEATAGVSLVLTESRLHDAGSTILRPGSAAAPVGGRSPVDGAVGNGLIPKLTLALPLSERMSAGLAVSAPFGLSTTYGAGDWARYSGLETSLAVIDLQPSLAFLPAPEISLGVALNAQYADARLSNALPNLAAALPDGSVDIRGDGWAFGWSAGLQWRPSERTTFGLAYKSSIDHRLKGQVRIEGLLGPLAALNSDAPVEARFSLPSQILIGTRVGATNRLTLNAQAVRLGWTAFDAIEFGPPLSQAAIHDYRDGWSVGAGFDYRLSPRLTVRAGVQAAETPIRDSLRDPKVPDSDRWTYGLGASWRAGRRFTIDTALTYVDLEHAPVRRDEIFYAGSQAQTLVQVRGATEGNAALLLSIGGAVEF